MQRYATRLDVRDVRSGDVDDLLAKLEELAKVSVSCLSKYSGVALELEVTYEVGDGGAAQDLWELRGVLDEVGRELAEWTDNRLGKPTLVAA